MSEQKCGDCKYWKLCGERSGIAEDETRCVWEPSEWTPKPVEPKEEG
jgi:hypothetical protein